jgi:flagellar biosynthesis anti-sigma factor FlgM
MRIDPKTVTPITGYKTRDQAPATTPAPAPADSSRASVVTLSTAGVAVSAPSPKAVGTGRIAQIRDDIANGKYPVDLDKLASRIVDDEINRGGSSS